MDARLSSLEEMDVAVVGFRSRGLLSQGTGNRSWFPGSQEPGPSPTMAHHADDRKACATFQEWTDRLKRPPVLDSYLGDAELLKNESPDIATF